MEATPQSRKNRITTACNPCRTRKHKCGGQRPNCEQCIDYNRTCEWPEQLKRGPAKGYADALEQRLLETENALLKIVSQLTDDQLSSSLLEQDSFIGEGKSQDAQATHIPMSHSRRQGVEYWKSFPLSDAQSIRRWQRDCYQKRQSSSPSQYDSGVLDFLQPAKRTPIMGGRDGESAMVEGDTSMQLSGGEMSSSPLARIHGSSTYADSSTINVGTRNGSLQRETGHLDRGTHEPAPSRPQGSVKQDIPKVSQEFSSWEAAPSKGFQEQFLW